MRKIITALTLLLITSHLTAQDDEMIGRSRIKINSDLMTPEALWAMGRIGGYAASPDGRQVAYTVTYYSVRQNKSHTIMRVINSDGTDDRQITTTARNESDPAWIVINKEDRIAFLSEGDIFTAKSDGTDRRQLTKSGEIEGFKFSPDTRKILYIKSIPYHGSIRENPGDLPKATGRLVTDMNYRHWDHYVETIPHPFVAYINDGVITEEKDILEGEPYECPAAPFSGIEQLDWSPDSRTVAYSCRKKEGVAYAISTDTDIFLYDTESGKTTNLCKPDDYAEPAVNATKSMAHQSVNSSDNLKNNPGYDQNPRFSPDGSLVAWLSMARDGYESDRNRLCIYNLSAGTKFYATEAFDSNVDDYCWAPDASTLYFIGVWHGQENMYRVRLTKDKKGVMGSLLDQLTDTWADFGSLRMLDKKRILAERHSFSAPADLYIVTPGKKTDVTQLTFENKAILDRLSIGECRSRWCATTDGGQEMYWIILPPHFDETKKYPALLFCEGGPQSPVSQFWSYRWNMQIMAANGYVIIAPNRHGLPGFGTAWLEEISGDWTGQCMDDLLSAIDDACDNLPYIDKNRLAAVGASFGGFSVYYLAGHHDKRFKCFIAHDGAFNLESMYTDTEETWFSNWEYDDAYWNSDRTERAEKTYNNSPHRFVDRWDTPILCIHGEKDYRICANQGMGAFNAARLRGIPAELLIFPDENHWVLKPQNGILWQRTFFNWLDRWLKPKK